MINLRKLQHHKINVKPLINEYKKLRANAYADKVRENVTMISTHHEANRVDVSHIPTLLIPEIQPLRALPESYDPSQGQDIHIRTH